MHQWNDLHEYYTMETQKCEIFQKVWNWQNWILFVPRVSVRREKKKRPGFVNTSPTWVIDTSTERSSRVLHHGNPNFFFKKVRNWIRLVFWLVLKSWNHLSRSQHAPICRHRGCIVVPLSGFCQWDHGSFQLCTFQGTLHVHS